MKKSKIQVGVFNGTRKTIEFKTVDNDLQTWYDIIDCRCIDIVNFAGYDLICDDEALLHGEPKPTILRYDNYDNLISAIYGTVVICRSYNEELDTLTDDDVEWLNSNILVLGVNTDEYNGYAMVDISRYYEPSFDYWSDSDWLGEA